MSAAWQLSCSVEAHPEFFLFLSLESMVATLTYLAHLLKTCSCNNVLQVGLGARPIEAYWVASQYSEQCKSLLPRFWWERPGPANLRFLTFLRWAPFFVEPERNHNNGSDNCKQHEERPHDMGRTAAQ